MNISQIFAIADKEMKLNFRFKWNYFGILMLHPLRFTILFSVVYSSFFISGAETLGGITKTNYISFLVLGALVHTFFDSGFSIFNSKFMQEKYWQTIQSFLIAPAHRLKLVIGIGLSELIRLVVVMGIFLVIAYFIMPINLIKLFLIILVILLLFLGTLGVGLIIGAFALANENILFLFNYLFWGWGFLSCFYYPLSALPKFLHPLVVINPIYHSVSLIRELWFVLPSNAAAHLYFILSFAILTPILGVLVFNKIIKKQGIAGY